MSGGGDFVTKKIFISYRRADTAWAAVCLREGLTRRLDVDVFLDFKTLFPGVEFAEAINGSIDACDILIAVIGPKWFTASNDDGTRRIDDPNDWVRMEIARGLEQGKTVIPVTCDEAVMPDESWFPEPLRPLAGRQALELVSKDYDPVIEGFANSLKSNYDFAPRITEHPARRPDPIPEPETGEARDPRTLFFMGLETFQTGDYRKAESEFAEAAMSLMGMLGYDDALTLRAQRWMSNSISAQGRTLEAFSILTTIAPIQRMAHGEESEDYHAIQYELACALLDQGRASEAEAAWRRLLPVEEHTSGVEHPNTLVTRSEIAQALLDQGNAVEAESVWQDILCVRERVLGVEHPDTLTTRYNIGRALLDKGEAAKAEMVWRDLLPLRERVSGSEHPNTLATHAQIAKALIEQGQASEAEVILRHLLPVWKSVIGPDHKHTVIVNYLLAKAFLVQKRTRKAVMELDTLAPIAARVMANTDPHLGYIAFLRAQCADALGDPAAADDFLAEAEANWGDRLTSEHPFRRELAAYLADRSKPSAS